MLNKGCGAPILSQYCKVLQSKQVNPRLLHSFADGVMDLVVMTLDTGAAGLGVVVVATVTAAASGSSSSSDAAP